jgi:excisionase family DNA binding protein
MTAVQEVSVREAAKIAHRSEETIRRWIWSGRLPAVKRGTSYRVDIRHLEEVMIELESRAGHSESPADTGNEGLQAWLEEVKAWKAGLATIPGASAADLVIEDRRARR